MVTRKVKQTDNLCPVPDSGSLAVFKVTARDQGHYQGPPGAFVGVVGWCDGAGLTSSSGESYNLDYSRARAYCTCSRCGWGLFGYIYSHLSFLSSFSLSLGDGPI